MEKDEVFFASDGLTSTSANHVANLAKEYMEQLRSAVDNISLVSSSVSIIDSDVNKPVCEEIKASQLKVIPEIMEKLGEVTALIAWLREANHQKEQLLSDMEDLSMDDYSEITGEKMPVLEKPATEKLTDAKWLARQSVKVRNKILSLTARASVYGLYIHKDGAFNNARKEYINRLSKKTEVASAGRDSLFYSYTTEIPPQEVENVFFAMQSRHRSLQAELNKYLNERQMAVKESEVAYLSELNRNNEAFTMAQKMFSNKFLEYKKRETLRISKLKIAIPNDLKEVYEEVNGLSK